MAARVDSSLFCSLCTCRGLRTPRSSSTLNGLQTVTRMQWPVTCLPRRAPQWQTRKPQLALQAQPQRPLRRIHLPAPIPLPSKWLISALGSLAPGRCGLKTRDLNHGRGPNWCREMACRAGPWAHRRQPAVLRKACQRSPHTQTPLLYRPPTLAAPASLQLSCHLHLPATTTTQLAAKPRSPLWCVPISGPGHVACCILWLLSLHLSRLKPTMKQGVDEESYVGIGATVLYDAGHSRLRGAACRAASAGKRPRKAGACAAAGHCATGDQRNSRFLVPLPQCVTCHTSWCVGQAPKWQDSGFVPKPLVAEPALPPKVAENLSYIPGKDVLPYEQLRGPLPLSGNQNCCNLQSTCWQSDSQTP